MKEKRFETPLDPQLKKTLQSLKEMPDRDAATAHHRKEQFIKSVIEIRQQKGISSSNQHPQKMKTKFAFLRNTMSAKLITIVLAVMIAIGGAGMGTVAASQNSLPNEVLYPVKQWSENTRLELTTNPEKEFNLHLDFADRRVDEFIEMLEEGNTPPKSLLQQYQQLLQLAAQLADKTGDPLQSKQQMLDRLQNQEQQMEMVQSADPLLEYTHQMLQQQLELIECEDGEDCETDLDGFDLDEDYDKESDEDSDNDADDDFDNDSDEDSDEDSEGDSDNGTNGDSDDEPDDDDDDEDDEDD